MTTRRSKTYVTLPPTHGGRGPHAKECHVFQTRRLPNGEVVRIVDADSHQRALEAVRAARRDIGMRGKSAEPADT